MRRAAGLALVFLACHGPRTRAPVADAGDAQAPATPPRGAPFVVALDHAVEDAFWLANGHLLAVTGEDLVDLEPTSGTVRHVALGHHADFALGVRGGDRIVAVDTRGERATVWDATTRRRVSAIEHATEPTLSGDGKRLSVGRCDGGKCIQTFHDLPTGTVVATIASPRPDTPGHVELSEDGRWALVDAVGALALVDATTGKTILTRKALDVSEGGTSMELVSFHGDRVLLTSATGIEVVGLPAGKVLARHANPFAGHPMVSKWASRDGSIVSLYDGPSKQLFTWDIATRKATMTPRVDEAPEAAPTGRFVVERAPRCRLVEQATKRVVLDHPAVCSAGILSRHAPGASPDERLYATVFEGGAHVFDLATGKHVAGIGPLPAAKMDHQDPLRLEAGIPVIGPPARPVWLSRTVPPKPAPRPAGFRSVAVTATHTFAVSQKGDRRTVLALDRTGAEVLRAEVPAFDESMMASDDTVFLRQGTSEHRCEVGAGCKEVVLDGYIASFDKPWVVVGARSGSPAGMKDHLLDIVTGEQRPLPSACRGASGARVFREGPVVFCPGYQGEPSTLTGADGRTSVLVLPASANHMTRLVDMAGPHLYFAGVVNAGLTPAYRIDARGGGAVTYFLGPGHAIAQLPDGKIAQFGDAAANDEVLRCLDGEQLLPWSACSAAFAVEGVLPELGGDARARERHGEGPLRGP